LPCPETSNGKKRRVELFTSGGALEEELILKNLCRKRVSDRGKARGLRREKNTSVIIPEKVDRQKGRELESWGGETHRGETIHRTADSRGGVLEGRERRQLR